MNETRATHTTMDAGPVDASARRFFDLAWAPHHPLLLSMAKVPANDWTFYSLRDRIGEQVVEVQTERDADEHFELNSFSHKQDMRFADFIRRLEVGPDNDCYMTAQNASRNGHAMRGVFGDLAPLPSFLRQNASEVMLWMGGRTMTPLHHDKTDNLLWQMVGTKLVRMISPMQVAKLENHVGVHSRLGWVTEEMAAERGITLLDFTVHPGEALFMPVGWWHCVRALEPSITALYTSFLWPNNWSAGFPA